MPPRLLCTATCIIISLYGRAAVAFLLYPSSQVSERVQVPVTARSRQRNTVGLAKGFGADQNKKPSARERDKDKKKRAKPSNAPAASAPCPCFSGNPYGECCKPVHDGVKRPMPVEVMRARYAAFSCKMPQFIMKSTHPDHEDFGKPGWRDDILVFCNNYKFTGLEVSQPEIDPDTPGKAYVYFTAMMAGAKGEGAVSFDERSIFLRTEKGEWLYKAPDPNYKESVKVISKRKYDATAKTDRPSGFSSR